MKKQFLIYTGLALFGIFLLAVGWEFWMEDLIPFTIFQDGKPESIAERWEYVFTITISSGIILTVLAILIYRQKLVEEALRESEKSYQILFNQLHSIVLGTSSAITSEKFFQSLVIHMASALNFNYAFIAQIIGEDRDRFRTIAFYANGKIVDNIEYDSKGTPCELVIKGEVVIFEDNVDKQFPDDPCLKEWKLKSYAGYPLFNDSGKSIGLLGVCDIKPIENSANIKEILSIFAARAEAELKRMQLEKNLIITAKELRRRNEELHNFTSIASHDLQEPLRKIIILGDRLESTLQPSARKGLDYLERMQKSAVRMRGFIEDLLLYTKLEAKTTSFENTDLKKIIKEVIDDLEARIIETRGTININNLPAVEADPFQMRQLFLNLIGNGLKFHREGVPPVINIDSFCKENRMWEITVEDNGIGIDEKHVDRIYKPFERLHGRSIYEGTGIGLTICNKIVNRHGGEISVKRHSENGVTFHFTLPEKQLEKNI